MKRSEKSHERNPEEFAILGAQRDRYFIATNLLRAVFNLVSVVEAQYTTTRIGVQG
jgi:hypothetical protein